MSVYLSETWDTEVQLNVNFK